MFTLQQLRSQIYELLNIQSDDSDIDDRLIDDLIIGKRQAWLEREFAKTLAFDRDIVQDLGCVATKQVDPEECCGDTTEDCYVVRTTVKLPTTLVLNSTKGFTRIGPTNKFEKQYTYVSFERVPFVGKGKYNKSIVYAFLLNGYIYLLSNNDAVHMIKKINVQGMFVDPTEASDFNDCDGAPCFSPLDKYPLPADMWEVIKKEIRAELLGKLSVPKDETNDSQDQATDQATPMKQ